MSNQATADYTRLKDAFLALVDLSEEARAARLAQIGREAPALAAALRRQLDAAGRPMPMLDRAVDAPTAPQLPQYRLIRELGRGGMGVVWLAERALDDARQPVALKQIAHRHWSEDDLRRFQRERRILATLDHPHIAGLIDGGTDAQGAPYFATQYIDGERLDLWCERQHLSLRRRVVLLRQIVSAVAHAHARLVVHRDLKPANILVTREGVPKLLDFGIARALQEEAVTREGPSQMTLRYAAPEQVAGEGGEGGVSVDIYALGVLLYEALARRSPYGDANGAAALLHAILHDEAPPPSRVAQAVPGVDADLDAICRKALRKHPGERYAAAGELLLDLDRWLEREPVEARRGERGYRLRAFLRRRWPWVAAAAVALGAIGYHLQAQRHQIALVERQRDKAQALADHFGRLFAEARPAETESGEVSARELLERSVTTLKADRERSAATRAALILASADALNYLGQVPAALDAAQEAMQLARSVRPPDPDLLATAHSELAGLLDKTGDNAGARREAAAGLALFDRGEAHERARRLTLMQQAAMFAESAGDREGARTGYEHVVRIARAELHVKDSLESYLAAQTNLATGDAGDPPRAERRLREALEVARERGFDDPATLVPMRTYLTVALYNQRRIDEARSVMMPTLVEARAFYGTQDPWLGMILGVAGNLEVIGGDPRRGDALLAESGRISTLSFGSEHPNARASQADRAIASVVAEDWPEALRRLEAMSLWLEQTGKGESMLAYHLRAAHAYVLARQHPDDAQRRAALLEVLGDTDRWTGKMRWLSEDWRDWARNAPAQIGAAAR